MADARPSDADLDEARALSRRALNARQVLAPDLPQPSDHRYRCASCGQLVDRRDLGDVLHHEQKKHDALPAELGFIEPMLPTLVSAAPEGGDWLHEIKYDGYRTQLVIERGEVRAFTRNGFDWTGRYRPIVEAAPELDCSSAIIDGEMIVQDDQGRSDFGSFKAAMTRRPDTLVFMAFDLLHANGDHIRSLPLAERRQRLRELVGCHDPGGRIQFSEHVTGGGAAMFEAADRMGLEGIVSKRARSRYRSGRSRDWLKVKCFAEAEFVVIGTERGTGGPSAALLARETAEGLEYAGSAMVTLADPDRERFWRAAEELATEAPAVAMPGQTPARWLRPLMRVRARYLKGADKLRHATLLTVEVAP